MPENAIPAVIALIEITPVLRLLSRMHNFEFRKVHFPLLSIDAGPWLLLSHRVE